MYDIRLRDGDPFTVAEVKDPLSYDIASTELLSPTPCVVTVKRFPECNAEKKIKMLQWIRHKNIVSVREIFNYEGSFYPIFEHMPMSLSHFTGIQKHLTERHLASILGQGRLTDTIFSIILLTYDRYLMVLHTSRIKG